MIFLVFVGVQLLAVVTFLALYLKEGWPNTPVGRHVAYWTIAAGVVDLSWLLLILAQKSWLIWLLLAAQGAVGLVTWQRVWLVWQARHRSGYEPADERGR